MISTDETHTKRLKTSGAARICLEPAEFVTTVISGGGGIGYAASERIAIECKANPPNATTSDLACRPWDPFLGGKILEAGSRRTLLGIAKPLRIRRQPYHGFLKRSIEYRSAA